MGSTTPRVLVTVAVLVAAVTSAQRSSADDKAVPLPTNAPATRYFAIHVVDDQTGRGVPLVELRTVANVRYYTDSTGLVAVDDPALTGRTAFFWVSGHGYEFAADGFGQRGARLEVTPGGSATLKIKRLNVAERLYRTTGEGIYRDSVLLGRPVPIKRPLLNAQVSGQDSVQAIVYRGKVRWFWGDTNRPSYPLGQFWMSGATSDLPGRGGLDPSVGVDLAYFEDADGFSRPMVPREEVPAWLDGLMTFRDDDGDERLLATVGLYKSLGECVGRRLVRYDDKADAFQNLQDIPLDAPLYPGGHPVRVHVAGTDYYYFPRVFPDVRVKADLRSVRDLSLYEAFTCLAPGARYEKAKTRLERDADGRLVWAWKKDTAALGADQIKELVAAGKMKADEAYFRPVDAATGEPVVLNSGSVNYNPFRKRWVMLATELGGKTSVLGETWYGEADRPEGPWAWVRKVVTHDRYSLYNPKHHPFFDQEGGRVIYFEGTYTHTFSREGDATPRYDYNQVMYRLDLSDPRLAPPNTEPQTRPARP